MKNSSQADDFIQAAQPYEKTLYTTCLNMLRNKEDAEDALQETMLKAFRSWSTFRADSQLLTWLRRIAVNVCIDMCRKKRNVLSIDDLQDEGTEPPDHSAGPYEKLEQAERMRILGQALTYMEPKAKALIMLRDIQNLSYEEIAQTLEQPVGTVKSGLSRAREKLRRQLNHDADLFVRNTVHSAERRERT